MFSLSFSHADGTRVNPESAGLILRNVTLHKNAMIRGAGEKLYFALIMTDCYSLLFHGSEVWSWGISPGPPLENTEVCLDSFLKGLCA